MRLSLLIFLVSLVATVSCDPLLRHLEKVASLTKQSVPMSVMPALDNLKVVSSAQRSSLDSEWCADGKSLCPDDSKRCFMPYYERYGCCPLSHPVCCYGHCYPVDWKCGDSVVCPNKIECTSGSTCCPYGSDYACCPLSNAVCCKDRLACCPAGFK